MRGLALLLLMAGFVAADARAQERLDIPYVEAGTARQRLDLYLPRGRGFATIVFVHGGSLTGGDKSEPRYAALCRAFVANGFGCASVGYRLFPTVDWPAPAADVASAVHWLRGNIARDGGDPARIFLMGHSSGCTLATLVSTDSSHLARVGLGRDAIAGTIAVGCRMNDRLDTAGIDPARVRRYLAEDAWNQRFRGSLAVIDSFRPMTHLRPGMPPVLLLLGARERFRPPILLDGTAYVSAALDCGADADLRVIDTLGHEEMIGAFADTTHEAHRRVVAFVRRVIAGGAPTARYDEPDLEACEKARR